MEMQSICIAIILKCNDLILRNKYVAQIMMSRNAVDRCNNRRDEREANSTKTYSFPSTETLENSTESLGIFPRFH